MSSPPSSSTSSTTATAQSAPCLLSPLYPLPHLVSLKLTKDNYLLWKARVVSYLRGQQLFGYADEYLAPPHGICHLYLVVSYICSSSTSTFLANYLKLYTVWSRPQELGILAYVTNYVLLVLLIQRPTPLCSFFRQSQLVIFFHVYVDGIIITGSDDTAISSVITSFGMELTVKDLGPLHYFFGVKAHFISGGLFLSRQRYVLNFASTHQHDACKICIFSHFI